MGDGEGRGNSSDELRGRAAESRLKLWLLLEADRRAVAGGLLGAVFVSLVAIGALRPAPVDGVFTQGDPIETAFQPLLGAIITGVTLVVTISQLVLSQELGAVGDQRERMEGSLSFRTDVADALDRAASPPDPATFLGALIDESAAAAAALDAATEDAPGEVRQEITELTVAIRTNASAVGEQLADARFGSFGVVSAALNYNYSWKLHRARRLQATADLSPDGAAALDRLHETLTLFGPAREHVKTLYFQWDLIDLSRTILYAAVPAIVVTLATVLYVDAGAIPGTVLGIDAMVWVVAALATVALAPFAVLVAYVLRIATVAKRTLAIGPFILRDTDRPTGTDSDGPGE